MKIGYTEFSFGYAFTENLIRSSTSKPTGAPVFPNLIQEGKLGYDVHIDRPGCPLYFQFKLPEKMVRSNAWECAKLAGFGTPFFRMPLMRRNLSEQHRLLVELEQSSTDQVYYATGFLHDVDEFNEAYNHARVHVRSAWFSPLEIGLISDDYDHKISYKDGLQYGWYCSEPRKVGIKLFEEIEQILNKKFDMPRFRRLADVALEMRKAVLALSPPSLRGLELEISDRIRARSVAATGPSSDTSETARVVEDILVAREMARVGLGVDLIIAQPAEHD